MSVIGLWNDAILVNCVSESIFLLPDSINWLQVIQSNPIVCVCLFLMSVSLSEKEHKKIDRLYSYTDKCKKKSKRKANSAVKR